MQKFPNTLPALRAAIEGLTPPDSVSDEFGEAITQASPVGMVTGVYSALSPIEDELSDEGRAVLCGCAKLIVTNQWHGLADEALETLMVAAPKLPDPPEPEAGENEDGEPSEIPQEARK